MATKIIILKHKNVKFSGYQLGVNFHKGRGSTSSDRDARTLVEKGICRDTAKEEEAKKAKDEAKKKGKEEEKEKEEPKAEEKK